MAEQRKTDRRVIRTENAIKSAFIDLLKKKGFEAITVNDIVNAVNISRGTFYLHYLDKYDLLAKMQDEFIQELSENLTTYFESVSCECTSQTFDKISRGYYNSFLSMFKENAALVLLYLDMDGEFSFMKKLRDLMEFNLTHNLYFWLNIQNTSIPSQYIFAYLFGSDIHLIIEWLKGKCVEPVEVIADYLLEMSSKGPCAIILSSAEEE